MDDPKSPEDALTRSRSTRRERLRQIELGESSARTGEVYLFGGMDAVRSVLRHLGSGVVAHAPDSSIVVCNPMACRILGLTMDQMLGTQNFDPQWRFLREDGSTMPVEEYPAGIVLTTRTALEDQIVGIHRPGDLGLAWALVNGFPVFDASGELELVLITFVDITARRAAELEKQRIEDQLRHSQKMEAFGQLAGGVAHDFNNLLTVINGYAELALLGLGADHAQSVAVQQIQNAGARAAELTAQLLAFARKQVSAPRVFQPNEVLKQAEKMLDRVIGENIELSFLPGESMGRVLCDPGQLEQIVVNLAVNARDAMPDGGRITIETDMAVFDGELSPLRKEPMHGSYVMIAVSDNGTGIPAELQARIFEPFFTTKAPSSGTGLGLSTVYGIVQQHNGHVHIYSEVGLGTTVRVYFPEAHDEAESVDLSPTGEVSRGDETILLVEDDTIVRTLAREMLTRQGYTVLEADGAAEAQEIVAEHGGTIDLLLTDVIMPHMNGPELAAALHAERPSLPVLFMSGYTANALAPEGVIERNTHFVSKPFSLRSLATAVRRAIESSAVDN